MREEDAQRDQALTDKEIGDFKILLFVVVVVALVCCGAGIGLGLNFA
jgi:hypothetical protein